MTSDYTQQQSLGGLAKAEQLSLQATVPPAEIPGFRLERLLGQGAFGQVWLATDLNTRRPVAIKFYLNRSSRNVDSLRREVSHLVNMSTGRHIVQVLAVGWDAEPPFYVMEYMENGSLEDLVRSRGPLAISEALLVLREIAEGLSYAHGRGVLHCDLKLANVVLDHAWRPRLADFGQGRLTNEHTPSLGTLFFMAPEQADLKASPDVAWDVYALGAIGYTLLVGSPPFRTPEVIESLDTASTLPDRLQRYRQTIERAPRPRLHYRRRGIDKALCTIIDRCLAVDPQRRYSNVQQVIEAIDARQYARARRPLYLMGIVAPILLLVLMMMFSVRSISLATQESLGSVRKRSLESNHFAARYVAQTLENEILSLFRVVEAEAQRDELRDLMKANEEANAALLDAIADVQKQEELERQLINSPERIRLESYAEQRLSAMIAKESDGNRGAIFNTLIVSESRGAIVAIAFTSEEEALATSPVGGNFAWRSYFNGERADGDRQRPAREYKATRKTHLSVSFRSTSTGAWKVGVSTPVWNREDLEEDGETPRAGAIPLGVFVITINLGDFELLSRTTEEPPADPEKAPIRFAALVDGRDGNQKGTLLQHPHIPAIQKMDRETMKTVFRMPQIPLPLLERLQADGGIGIYDYQDPAAEFEKGTRFEGGWLASIEQVSLPRMPGLEEGRTKSDLWILVQEPNRFVDAPIETLGDQLQRESFIELGTLLLVVVVLWYFVFRLGQASLAKTAIAGGQGPVDKAPFESTIESNL